MAWYGFRSVPSTDKVHVLVPHGTHKRSAGFVVIMRTESLDPEYRDAGCFRVVSRARAVIDAGRMTDDRRSIEAFMAEAVQSQSVPVGAMDAELRRANRSRTAVVRSVLRDIHQGVRSAPEAELRRILARSRKLSEMVCNPELFLPDGTRLPTPDCYFPDARLAVEVDSREHHSAGEDWERTMRRHNILSQHGILSLHFSPAQIYTDPDHVRSVVERTHSHRRSVSRDAALYRMG